SRSHFRRDGSGREASHQPPRRCLRQTRGGTVLSGKLADEPPFHIARGPVAANKYVSPAAVCQRAADFPRLAPDDLCVMANRMPVAIARDVREMTGLEVALFGQKMADHLIRAEVAAG